MKSTILILLLVFAPSALAQTNPAPVNAVPVPAICPIQFVCLTPSEADKMKADAAELANLQERLRAAEDSAKLSEVKLAELNAQIVAANAERTRLIGIVERLIEKLFPKK